MDRAGLYFRTGCPNAACSLAGNRADPVRGLRRVTLPGFAAATADLALGSPTCFFCQVLNCMESEGEDWMSDFLLPNSSETGGFQQRGKSPKSPILPPYLQQQGDAWGVCRGGARLPVGVCGERAACHFPPVFSTLQCPDLKN